MIPELLKTLSDGLVSNDTPVVIGSVMGYVFIYTICRMLMLIVLSLDINLFRKQSWIKYLIWPFIVMSPRIPFINRKTRMDHRIWNCHSQYSSIAQHEIKEKFTKK